MIRGSLYCRIHFQNRPLATLRVTVYRTIDLELSKLTERPTTLLAALRQCTRSNDSRGYNNSRLSVGPTSWDAVRERQVVGQKVPHFNRPSPLLVFACG